MLGFDVFKCFVIINWIDFLCWIKLLILRVLRVWDFLVEYKVYSEIVFSVSCFRLRLFKGNKVFRYCVKIDIF